MSLSSRGETICSVSLQTKVLSTLSHILTQKKKRGQGLRELIGIDIFHLVG